MWFLFLHTFGPEVEVFLQDRMGGDGGSVVADSVQKGDCRKFPMRKDSKNITDLWMGIKYILSNLPTSNK